MTREEAIEILKNTIVRFGRTNGKTAYAEALQMAVKALEEPQWRPCSEPPEEDGVYIVYAPTYSGGSSSAKECHDGVMFSKYKNGKWSIEHGYYSRPNCVKAWKPLDEPCRGEGEPK